MSTKEEILAAQQAELKDMFEQWRRNPTTQMFFNRVVQLKNHQLELSVRNAFSRDIPDTQFRYNACAAATVETVIAMLTDFEKFYGKQ